MPIVFDDAKDAVNVVKHGVSLSRTQEFEPAVIVVDDRTDYGEPRFRAFGYLEGAAYCLAFTYRGRDIRPISLRRAHAKEMKRHGA